MLFRSPYFYCVLVARPAFGLLERYRPQMQPDITVEESREKDVHIIVIRQTTTETSGYYTKPVTVGTLFFYALSEARKALAQP